MFVAFLYFFQWGRPHLEKKGGKVPGTRIKTYPIPKNFLKRLDFVQKSIKTAEKIRHQENWFLKLSQKILGKKQTGQQELKGAKFLVAKAQSYFQQGNLFRASHWLTRAQYLLLRAEGYHASNLERTINRGQKFARFGIKAGDTLFKMGVVGAIGAWGGPAVAELLEGPTLLGACKAWGLVSMGGAGALGLSSISKRAIEGKVLGVKNLKAHAMNPQKMNRDLIEGAFSSSLQLGLPLTGALGAKSAEGLKGIRSFVSQLKYTSLYQAAHGAAETRALGGNLKQTAAAAALGAAMPIGFRGLEKAFAYPGKVYARLRAGKTLGPWKGITPSEEFTTKVQSAQEKFGLSAEELSNPKLLKKRFKKWSFENHPDRHPGRSDADFKNSEPLWKWLINMSENQPSALARASHSVMGRPTPSQSQGKPKAPLQLTWEEKKLATPIKVVDLKKSNATLAQAPAKFPDNPATVPVVVPPRQIPTPLNHPPKFLPRVIPAQVIQPRELAFSRRPTANQVPSAQSTQLAEFSPKTQAPKFTGYYGVKLETSSELTSVVQRLKTQAGETLHLNPPEDLHITLIDPADIKSAAEALRLQDPTLSKGKAQEEIKGKIKILPEPKTSPRVTGIGFSEGKTKEGKIYKVYYATVSWPEGQAIRQRLNLPEKDFHITLGSTEVNNGKPLDVHGVPKNNPNVIQFVKTSDNPSPSTSTVSGPGIPGSLATLGIRRAHMAIRAAAQGLIHLLTPEIPEMREVPSPVEIPSTETGLLQLAQAANTQSEGRLILWGMFQHGRTSFMLRQLDQNPSLQGNHSRLEDLFPRLSYRRILTQDPRIYGNRTVKDQILFDLEKMEEFLNQAEKENPALHRHSHLLKMAAFFMSMGKHGGTEPSLFGLRKEINGRKDFKIRFPGYPAKSAELFESFIRQTIETPGFPGIRLSEADIALGRHLIERHLDAIELINNFRRPGEKFTPAALKKFIKKLCFNNKELLHRGVSVTGMVHLALAVMETPIRFSENYPYREEMHQKFRELKHEILNRLPAIVKTILKEANPCLIDGKDIKALANGKLASWDIKTREQLIGKIRRRIHEQQLEGTINSRADAVRLAQELLGEALPGLEKIPDQVTQLINNFKIPKHLLGLKVHTQRTIRDPKNKLIAMIRYFKAEPIPQFHGEVEPAGLRRLISSGLYPNLQKAIYEQSLQLGTVIAALKIKGFRNLLEIELFLQDNHFLGSAEKILGEVKYSSAPTAPLIEITRPYQGRNIKITIDRGWQGTADHTGTGGFHFLLQRSGDLRNSKIYDFKLPGETDEAMLARFAEHVTVGVLTSPDLLEIPSDRDPNKFLLIGPANGDQEAYGNIVIDKTDPNHWKVVTTMYRPTPKEMRSKLIGYSIKQLFKTPGQGWGKDTLYNPTFQKVFREANEFLMRRGLKPLSLDEVTPEEFKLFQKNIVIKAIGAMIKKTGFSGKKVQKIMEQLLGYLRNQAVTTEEALKLMQSENFHKTLTDQLASINKGSRSKSDLISLEERKSSSHKIEIEKKDMPNHRKAI